MHRVTPPPGERRRPCVFCNESLLQIHGRLATNRETKITGMAHEHCWAKNYMEQAGALSDFPEGS